MTQLSTADLGGVAKDGKSRLNNGWTTEEAIKEAADEYNQLAANNKKEGFAQVLHNEAFALSRTVDGRLTYPLLIHYLDPALVGMGLSVTSVICLSFIQICKRSPLNITRRWFQSFFLRISGN